MLRMNTELVVTAMQDRGMKTLKPIMQCLCPAETLATVTVWVSSEPLPVCVTPENNRTRIVALPDNSLGHGLASQLRTVNVQALQPEWSVMCLSHTYHYKGKWGSV
jgi:hypothetical protein